MTVRLEYEIDKTISADDESLIRRVVEEACDYAACPYEAEVNVVITDNEGIRRVNQEYRQIDAPTDVLSFPMLSYEEAGNFDFLNEASPADFHPDTGELLLGDIMLNYDRILSQAEQYGHSVERELAFLTAHSMFHLFGYDHMEEEERMVMEKKQEELMQILGISR